MTVAKWMTTDLITINKEDPVSLAFELVLTNDIRHLPVLSRGTLVGIITDRDLHEAVVPSETSGNRRSMYHTIKEVTVEKIMTPKPISIGPNTPIEQAVQILLDRRIDCLPVTDNKSRLIGIITSTDILRAFLEFMHILKETQRIDIVMETSDIETVSNLIQKHGGKIISIGITAHDDPTEKVYSFRVRADDMSSLVSLLRAKGYAVLPSAK
jgi:acetoin utilization protein AcuB